MDWYSFERKRSANSDWHVATHWFVEFTNDIGFIEAEQCHFLAGDVEHQRSSIASPNHACIWCTEHEQIRGLRTVAEYNVFVVSTEHLNCARLLHKSQYWYYARVNCSTWGFEPSNLRWCLKTGEPNNVGRVVRAVQLWSNVRVVAVSDRPQHHQRERSRQANWHGTLGNSGLRSGSACSARYIECNDISKHNPAPGLREAGGCQVLVEHP